MKKKNWGAKIAFFGVYILLFLGITGVLLLDVIWKKAAYLFIIFLMMDILYKRYYNKKNAINNK